MLLALATAVLVEISGGGSNACPAPRLAAAVPLGITGGSGGGSGADGTGGDKTVNSVHIYDSSSVEFMLSCILEGTKHLDP